VTAWWTEAKRKKRVVGKPKKMPREGPWNKRGVKQGEKIGNMQQEY